MFPATKWRLAESDPRHEGPAKSLLSLSKWLFGGLCWLVLASPAFAQTATHWLEVGVERSEMQTRDVLASELRYEGLVWPLWMQYERRGESYTWSGRVAYHHSSFLGDELTRTLEPASFSNLSHSYFRVHLGLQRHFPVPSIPRLEASLGIQLGTTGQVKGYKFRDNSREISWEVINALSINGEVQWKWAQSAFILDVSSPMLAHVNRPPYAVEGDLLLGALFSRREFVQLGNWASIGSLRALFLAFMYEHTVSSSSVLRAGLTMQAYRYDEPARTATHTAGLYIGWMFKVGGTSR